MSEMMKRVINSTTFDDSDDTDIDTTVKFLEYKLAHSPEASAEQKERIQKLIDKTKESKELIKKADKMMEEMTEIRDLINEEGQPSESLSPTEIALNPFIRKVGKGNMIEKAISGLVNKIKTMMQHIVNAAKWIIETCKWIIEACQWIFEAVKCLAKVGNWIKETAKGIMDRINSMWS